MLPFPRFRKTNAIALCMAGLMVQACTTTQAVKALPPEPDERTTAIAQIKDDINALNSKALMPVIEAPSVFPVRITGHGFSQISGQPGGTLNEKRLMAIRAARLEALRDLTEQIHGIRLTSETSLRDATLTDDRIRAIVQGEIRGARTVRITPKDADSFEVVLSLDADTVRYILRAAKLGV